MAECIAARREYDSAYARFEAEAMLIREHQQRIERADNARPFTSRIRRYSSIAQLSPDTIRPAGMRLAYAELERRREHYFAAVKFKLQRELAAWESARKAKDTAFRIRMTTPTCCDEYWRVRGKPLLCGISACESELSVLDVRTAFLSSQIMHLVEEKQRAGHIHEHMRVYRHMNFPRIVEIAVYRLIDASAQQDHNIQAALQHKTAIDGQLISVRSQLWEVVDKRKDTLPGLRAYIDAMQEFLRREIHDAQLSQTDGELTERAVREARAQHDLSVFMHEQATVADERASKLLIDVKAIWTIENDAGEQTPAKDYVQLAEKRAFEAGIRVREAKAAFDITAAALHTACELARAIIPPITRTRTNNNNTTRRPHAITVPEWLCAIDQIFPDYASILSFPEPPAVSCIRQSCKSQRQTRALTVCDCAVRAAFATSNSKHLKRERIRWHPDKWSCCRADQREVFEKKASEIFIVLDAMYREKKGASVAPCRDVI